MLREAKVRHTAVQVGRGILGVAAVTAVCYSLHLDFAIAGFLYLLTVVLQSPTAGFAASAIVSLGAVLCLDYFFTPPILRLEIGSPIDGVALLTYTVTSLIITRLASRAREEARLAERKQEAIACLYQTAFRLFSVEPHAVSSQSILQIFREVLSVESICLYDAAMDKLETAGIDNSTLAGQTKAACRPDRNFDESGMAVRRLHVAGVQIGAIGFAGLANAESLADSLSMLAAASLERARSFQTAAAAAATSQTEVLRTAIVDAFAHQFKTPLAAILAAAGGIQQAGALGSQQQEMVELIESEAICLNRLATRLLATARLDHAEVQPRLEPADLIEMVTRLVKESASDGHSMRMQLHAAPVAVACDRELLNLALSQLIENAVKYAAGRTPIDIAVAVESGEAQVRVTNRGNRIAADERERIFERFYRGESAKQAARGAGLGLYVARKIAVAHRGRLALEECGSGPEETTFCLTLPNLEAASQHAWAGG
jgi:two-component system sensor histidine kinase KdpD